MRRSYIFATVAVALTVAAVPVSAVGLGDLAKAVLGGKSVLKKAEKKCGKEGALTASDNMTIDSAVAAVRKALAPDKFALVDNAAQVDADTQAQSSTFCPETKKKKKGILGKIAKAGKGLLKGGKLPGI